MDVEAALAGATSTAYGAAIVIQDGEQVASRGGYGGYTRITATSMYWGEVGDIMPGQPIYATAIPFYTPVDDGTVPISIVGGRSFTTTVTVSLGGVVQDITNAQFVAQIRQSKYHVEHLAQFQWSIVDGPTGQLMLTLSPESTWTVSTVVNSAVWDVEMLLNGSQYTVVPESKVTVTPGISQSELSLAYPASAAGVASDATTVNS